jgi:hypothetical protein
MSEMVERVTGRIQEALREIACGENDSPVYEHIARAAIEAMREPTEGMVEAAWKCQAVEQIWPAMIDECLR